MKILGIAGRKQSGKNTVANFINGHVLKSKNMVQDFYIDGDGKLVVKTDDSNGNSGFGIFDVTRKDSLFIEYAERDLWPYIKIYHFADPLKEMAIDLFELNADEIYGTDSDKNKNTNIDWSCMPFNGNKTGKMTNREFLEHFGTKIVRNIKNDAWSKYTVKRILAEQSDIAIIPDVRFPNEVEAIKNCGGKVIRLTRDVFNSKAEAEVALDQDKFDWDNFDLVLDNQNISLDELCDQLSKITHYWEV